MSDAVHIDDYRERALARLPSAFADAPNLRGLLAAMADGVQQLETRFAWPLHEALRNPSGASGSLLDVVGRAVIEPRRGRSNLRYRGAIEARILTNSSTGQAARLTRILELLLGLSPGAVRALSVDGAVGFQFESDETISEAERDRFTAQLQSAANVVVSIHPIIQGEVGRGFTLDSDTLGLDSGELCEEW